jgi:DNA-binding MarR family transcriptional regulator
MRGIEFKNEVGDLIRLITTGMDEVFRPIVESYGLTMLQTRLLFEIAQSELATVGSLGNVVGLSSGNASTMCKKLEKAGFITRVRNTKDERFVKLVLTELGSETIQKIDAALQAKYAPILESQSHQDFDTIIAGMKKLNELLTEMEKIY